MTRVGVRSEALHAVAARVGAVADELRDEASALATALARCRPPGPAAGWALLGAWVRVEDDGAHLVGPTGLWGEAVALDGLALRLRGAARAYEEVEAAAAAVLAGVASGARAASRVGVLGDGGRAPVVVPVVGGPVGSSFAGPADLVALGDGLDGGRVRVVEVAAPGGGSAWVVVVPGTQVWSPVAGSNPFDLTTDVRAVTGATTVAAAGVVAALDTAMRASAARRGLPAGGTAAEPVLLVGHSQGGILAAGLAADARFAGTHHVTHVVTTGSPVALFPVPAGTHVLSVEHADDPVPTLDLSPNPGRPGWLTLRVGDGAPTAVSRHRLAEYERTLRAAQDAPHGAVPGLPAWESTAGDFLHRPVESVTEVVVARAGSRRAPPAGPP